MNTNPSPSPRTPPLLVADEVNVYLSGEPSKELRERYNKLIHHGRKDDRDPREG